MSARPTGSGPRFRAHRQRFSGMASLSHLPREIRSAVPPPGPRLTPPRYSATRPAHTQPRPRHTVGWALLWQPFTDIGYRLLSGMGEESGHARVGEALPPAPVFKARSFVHGAGWLDEKIKVPHARRHFVMAHPLQPGMSSGGIVGWGLATYAKSTARALPAARLFPAAPPPPSSPPGADDGAPESAPPQDPSP